jgi:hypothetical protein
MQETTNRFLSLEVLLIFYNVQRGQALYDIKLNNKITRRSKAAKHIKSLLLLVKIRKLKGKITSSALHAGRARNMHYLNTSSK